MRGAILHKACSSPGLPKVVCLLLLQGRSGGVHELGGVGSGVLEAVAKHWRALLSLIQVMGLHEYKQKQIR